VRGTCTCMAMIDGAKVFPHSKRSPELDQRARKMPVPDIELLSTLVEWSRFVLDLLFLG
jgi:hypothetical protein